MAMDEWRHCVDWLVRCNILPEEHRATQSDASAFDLAQTLRDGVLICHLLNTLSPNSVDLKDFSQRPQLSQFLCLKNIRTFLQTCQNVFGLSTSDLFDPLDLFEVKDFRKVLTTLSKLSKTAIARRRQSGFKPPSSRSCDHEYYNSLEDLANGFPPEQTSHRPSRRFQDDDEDIYGNLPDLALHHDLDDNEEIYDHVYQEDDDEIYEDLCTRNRRESSISELPVPVTKRDYCIKELHDTEKNYVDALRMIHLQFNKPLKDIISKGDRDVIFAHIEKLLDVHQKFQAELQSACISGKPKIGEVFVKYKKSLLLYGNYCSDMPKAQERLEEVTRRNENIRTQIEYCEQRANDGKFKLRDLLHVPMQRVLKYHLLLRELIKQSGKQAEDKDSLEQGLEAMMDLSLYVNEVKRDNETLQLIEEIQSSIGDLQMPANTTLKDYGRLQKDGELKVKNHTDNKIRIRYIFLFDKVMLMCKAKMVDRLFSGESYSFKEAIILAVYKVQDQQTANRETQRRGDKWNSSFIMGKKDGSNAFSFFAKTEDMKAKWIDAIKLALENASPPQGINYVMHTFDQPTECSVCGKLLRGVFFQGYKCTDPGSDIAVHKECIGKQPNTGSRVPPIPARVIETCHFSTYMEVIHENHRSDSGAKSRFECGRADINLKERQVRALCNYTGNPNPGGGRPALRFQKDDVIKLLNNDAQWWKGLLNGDEGWFPSQLVQEIENRIRRKPSYLDVKIRSRTENGTPSNISPPRAHSPANNKPYVNVVDDDRSSDQLSVYKWFVGPMGRDTANHRLEHMPNGTFLIRVSENPGRKGELSLSIRYDNQVRHIRVEKNTEGLFYLADTKFFSSLPELVEFYQENSLADSFPGVDTTLKFPFKTQSGGGANTRILGYAEAVYDYAATATSQLSLCRGDKVAILSKTGSDKGWWKGEHCVSGKNGYFPLAYVRELDDD